MRFLISVSSSSLSGSSLGGFLWARVVLRLCGFTCGSLFWCGVLINRRILRREFVCLTVLFQNRMCPRSCELQTGRKSLWISLRPSKTSCCLCRCWSISATCTRTTPFIRGVCSEVSKSISFLSLKLPYCNICLTLPCRITVQYHYRAVGLIPLGQK